MRWLAVALIAVFVASGLQSAPAQAAAGPSQYVEGTDPGAFLFDPLNVNTIQLTLPQDSLRALSADTYSNQVGWQPGSAVFTSYKGTLPQMNIGMHLKGGWGSRRRLSICTASSCRVVTNTKPAMKVKFNFGVGNENQNLYGQTELTLNSMVQDSSMIHETTDYRLARAIGLPSPRTGYVHVYVNGVDLGLHLLVETYAKSMYSRWFPAGTQHAYEGIYWQDLIDNSDGTVSNYTALQVHTGSLATSGEDLKAIAAINDLSGAAWWQAINLHADVGELTKDWAFEHFVQQWDAYSWFVINNYYVHFDKNGVMTMLPWGMDQTLVDGGGDQDVKFLDATTVSGKVVGVMFSKCLSYSPCRQLYQGQLANLGATADSLNLPGFIDQVWQQISVDVLSDRINQGNGATWGKEAAKMFLASRTSIPEYLAAVTTRRLANLSLSYSEPATFAQDEVLPALIGNNTDKAPRFAVLGDQTNPVCSVDSTTGAITVLNPGDCEVSMQTVAGVLRNSNGTSGFQAGYAIAVVHLPKLAGTITLIGSRLLPKLKALPLHISASSSGAQIVTTNSKCTFANGQLYAKVPSGTCLVTVAVEKDARYSSAKATFSFVIDREIIRSYKVTSDPYFVATSKLPKGQMLRLVHSALRTSGNCSANGNDLKALASSGSCKVTIAAWKTEGQSFVQKTFTILMGPSAQTWSSKVTAAVVNKKIGDQPFQLANTPNVLTNLKNEGLFNSTGPCEVIAGLDSTYVVMNGPGLCTVRLSASGGYKVSRIYRVWSFTN